MQRLPSTAKHLAAVQSTFALNKSQLATAFGVKLQTIYDWYAGNLEAEGRNAERLTALYRLVTIVRRSGLRPIPSKAAEKPLFAGKSLIELLSKSGVDTEQVLAAVGRLQCPAAGESAREQRKRLGWEPLTEEQRQKQLESNLDSFLDGSA